MPTRKRKVRTAKRSPRSIDEAGTVRPKKSIHHVADEALLDKTVGDAAAAGSSPDPLPESVVVESTVVTKPHAKYAQMLVFIPAVLLIVGLVAISGYYFIQYKKSEQVLNSKTGPTTEVATLVKRVNALIELPSGETPTIATVTDVTKLQTQPFFTHAQNGDKVLIFTKAKKAILFRPTSNKLVEVGPVNITDTPKSPTPEPSVTPSPTGAVAKVVLYNGTTTSGLTLRAEAYLKAQKMVVSVVNRANATKSNYEKTVVVDLTGKEKETASRLASSLHAVVETLPIGEDRPAGAEILIILGKDFASR